jgi:hypothetical protein
VTGAAFGLALDAALTRGGAIAPGTEALDLALRLVEIGVRTVQSPSRCSSEMRRSAGSLTTR